MIQRTLYHLAALTLLSLACLTGCGGSETTIPTEVSVDEKQAVQAAQQKAEQEELTRQNQ